MTGFNHGERVLAPHPDDPSGALAGALRDLAAAVERMANAVEPREP